MVRIIAIAAICFGLFSQQASAGCAASCEKVCCRQGWSWPVLSGVAQRRECRKARRASRACCVETKCCEPVKCEPTKCCCACCK